jgi:hypothetical protein
MLVASRKLILALSMELLIPPIASADDPRINAPLPEELFPSDNWWSLDISSAPVDSLSDSYLSIIGDEPLHADFDGDGSTYPETYGIPWVVVDGSTPWEKVAFTYGDESDGDGTPFYPIPVEAKTQVHFLEGGHPGKWCGPGDKHLLLVDPDNNYLYELWNVCWTGTTWTAGSGARFELGTNNRRPDGWTSADAAGLAILPGLIRYDEAFSGGPITHAFRFTLHHSSTTEYVYPASHIAGTLGPALPFGARLRMKPGIDLSGYPAYLQRIFQAMKTYGLIFADNGSDIYVSGQYDPRWNWEEVSDAFDDFHASDFEVIERGWTPPLDITTTSLPDCIVGQPYDQRVRASHGYNNYAWTIKEGVSALPAGLSMTSTGTWMRIHGTCSGSPGTSEFTAQVSDAHSPPWTDEQSLSITAKAFYLRLSDASIEEGDFGYSPMVFTVTLSPPSEEMVTVAYATDRGSARPGIDYLPTSGTLTLPAGSASATIRVMVVGDRLREGTETFWLHLSAPQGASILDGRGLGWILDDDGGRAPGIR